MKFREIENIENAVVASIETTAISSYQLEMLSEYLEKEKRKSEANENPFVYFYEDVISCSLEYNFQITLGIPYFKNASDDAKSCIHICNDFYKLSSWSIIGWLPNALKFVDNIVLHYLQESLKEVPKTYYNAGVEKGRYIHLSEKAGVVSAAGYELKELYDLRNELEHRTIIYPDGRQELVTPKRNKVRQIVLKLYPEVLKRILITYKELPL